ncbi:MAG: DUF3576 domain-containing protein [Parvibaculaceae bacterium]|nr:DUF3576 domain-containing protein [Parvibaculaceae bacterium]
MKFVDRGHRSIGGTGAARSGQFRTLLLVSSLGLALGIAGCSAPTSSFPASTTDGTGPSNPNPDPNAKRSTIFGEGGITLFDAGGSSNAPQGPSIGVNSFLWRASLDTISFMPLASADPFGGVIITDWYSAPASPNERFKLTVYILASTLRADAVKVSIFRQTRPDAGSAWADTPPEVQMTTQIENAILTRARQLRSAAVEAQQNNSN